MALKFQVTFDCAGPDALARFWAEALGYELQDPPEGFDTWGAYLASVGVPEDEWDTGSSIVDPEGVGARIYFQQVPEGKSAKNRLHLDVDVSRGRAAPLEERRASVDEAVVRLAALGATKLYEASLDDHYAVTMQDPEGNEFCVL